MKKYIILLLILLGVYWFINHRADQPSIMTDVTDAAQIVPDEVEKEEVIFSSPDEDEIEDVTPPLLLNGDVLDEDVVDSDLGIEILDDQGLDGQDGEMVMVEPEYE